MKRRIAILGSTGSIGTQALDVVRKNPDLFEVELLVAGNNTKLLAAQAREFDANMAIIGNEAKYEELKTLLEGTSIKVFAGEESICRPVFNGCRNKGWQGNSSRQQRDTRGGREHSDESCA